MTLTISDVPGDDPSIIASGPTVPDATTCADALAILKRYRIDVPGPVADLLEKSARWKRPSPETPPSPATQVHMIATPQQSLEAAAAAARAAGLDAHILSDEMEGESREVGKVHAALARGGGAPRPAVCAALRDPERRRDHRHGAPARTGRSPRAVAGGPASSAWAWRWRCRASPACTRWRPTPTASTAWKTTPGRVVAPDTLARGAGAGP